MRLVLVVVAVAEWRSDLVSGAMVQISVWFPEEFLDRASRMSVALSKHGGSFHTRGSVLREAAVMGLAAMERDIGRHDGQRSVARKEDAVGEDVQRDRKAK